MPVPAFRFAPSPNGPLHLGHAYSALLNAGMARQTGGRFLLRIEDIDPARCRPEFEAAIYRDLAWLGLGWEQPVRRQSEHFPLYADALARLRADGLVYPAFLSRAGIAAQVAEAEAGGMPWPRDPDGAPHYPPGDRDLAASVAAQRIAEGEPYAWRLRLDAAIAAAGPLAWTEASGVNEVPEPAGVREARSETGARQPADPAAWGDVILARREVPTSYHLSVVVDDAAQGITHIVRGRDLFAATSVHRLLQSLLGLPEPAYFHHRLITGADGRKLAKSDGATGLADLRAAGVTRAEVRRRVGLEESA